MPDYFPSFAAAYRSLCSDMVKFGQAIHTEKWQSIEVAGKPEAEMRELINVYFSTRLTGTDIDEYRRDIKPNLPWADRHFELERISGHPINPGWTWKEWPWAHSADKFRREGEQYSHSYAERYWPKLAGRFNEEGGIIPSIPAAEGLTPLRGVRYDYGDLSDVVNLLAREPLTRQAYLPVWFPEDTGVAHGERVPCTLGYHFMLRAGLFHCFYPIRSCDLTRHLRDDWYLTVRLQLWILGRLQAMRPTEWAGVKPGLFTFWAGSLHCFINDWRKLEREST